MAKGKVWDAERILRLGYSLFRSVARGVFITTQAFQGGMGREIVSISVPIGSQEWHLIQQWKQDSNTNVSVNICAALRDSGEVIAHNEALKLKLANLGKLLNSRKHRGLSKEEWDECFGMW